ncbi:MAG: serine protease [Planctomycetaceae bacterium]|nr:serine protease [Planctomycetaceae bacterium]
MSAPVSVSAQLTEAENTATIDRGQLYDELAAEVEALGPQLGLLKRVARLVKPTVVHIDASKPRSAGVRANGKPLEEAGSGVIVETADKFYVITNRHVIDDSDLNGIAIKLYDGRIIHPTNLWADRETDVAVMAVGVTGLTAARIGSSDDVEIGEFVIAVGSPFGLSHSITYGIISAKGRRDLQLGDGNIRYQDFMQTDAAINPGNSGGPLVNLRGEVVGINTAIASSSGGSEGIGFTIPIDMAITVAQQFIEHGRPVRAFLGVNLNGKDYDAEYAARLGLPSLRGALVDSVIGNSPAVEADMRPDDVVLEFDGHKIEDDDHLIKIVGFTRVAKEVEVVVFREGEVIQLHVKLSERRRAETR